MSLVFWIFVFVKYKFVYLYIWRIDQPAWARCTQSENGHFVWSHVGKIKAGTHYHLTCLNYGRVLRRWYHDIVFLLFEEDHKQN